LHPFVIKQASHTLLAEWIFRYLIEEQNQARGFAIQPIPVPVPSQDKLGGLQQEGHAA